MGLALICAGQGMQHPGMFLRLRAEPAAASILATASAHCGFDLAALDTAADDARLHSNATAQVLVVAHAVAAAAALAEAGIAPAVCAGYSVGEMAAHACAGAWSAEEALALTVARAAAMDEAAASLPEPLGMVAVVGLDARTVEALAGRHRCAIAIVNAPDHFVLGGPTAGVAAVADEAPALGARTVRPLAISIASHTAFLAAAVAPFARRLEGAVWKPPHCPVLSGLDGRPVFDRPAMAALLSRQLAEPLDWATCLASVLEHGATAVLELGPGRAMTRLLGETHSHLPARAFEDFRSAAGAAAWARRHC